MSDIDGDQGSGFLQEENHFGPSHEGDVGYRKPPKHGQFKPGQSGNPKGRPPSPRNLAEAIDKRLSQKMTITENGVSREVPIYEALAMKLINDALSSSTHKSNAAIQKISHLGVAGHVVKTIESRADESPRLDPQLEEILGFDLRGQEFGKAAIADEEQVSHALRED